MRRSLLRSTRTRASLIRWLNETGWVRVLDAAEGGFPVGSVSVRQTARDVLSTTDRYPLAFVRNKLQCETVVAPTLPGGPRAVVKDMSLVAAATAAVIFGTGKKQLKVALGLNSTFNGREEARPTCAAVEFHLGGE